MWSSWLDRFRPIQHEEINNARLHRLVQAEVERRLAPLGFESAGDLKWVRDRDLPIRHVFTFNKWKGGIVTAGWGVSLDFVPHVSGNQVRWHRSNKAALQDLRVDARDAAITMSYINGVRPIQRAHRMVVETAVERAKVFWARCETVAALPDAIDWLKAYYDGGDGLGFYNFTQHPLAVAMLLAKTGRVEEGVAELDRHCSYLREDVLSRLKSLVEAARV